jgi:hypothetical protein
MLIKVALKFNFTFISSIRNGSCHLKKSSLKNCSRRMKHKKNVVDSAKKRPNLWQVSKVKINYLFLMVQEL